jgi:5-methylcytosine-specific restriction endonuclease McrA
MTNYEKLLDTPQWRARSARIKERDNYVCRGDNCNRRTDLQVHHLKYTTALPWDEPSENLITLCDICHYAVHRVMYGDVSPSVAELVLSLIKTA